MNVISIIQDLSDKIRFHPIFIYFFNKFIYLFFVVLGLYCSVRAFSSCGERGLLFVAGRGPLIVVASLVAEHRLQVHGPQQLWHTVLVALWHVGSSQARARTCVTCIGRQILNHCATRESLNLFLNSFKNHRL